jgi:hypothetical protein
MTKEGTDCGIILDFTIEELDNGSFVARNIGYVPIYVWKHGGLLTVLPSGSYIGNRPEIMTDDEYNKMVNSYNATIEILGDADYRVLDK